MSDTAGSFAAEYARALEAHLRAGEETNLARAQELGRRAFSEGLGVLQLVELHAQALDELHSSGLPLNPSVATAALEFQMQALTIIEMAARGFQTASERLRDVLAVSDVGLERLEIEDLLAELLDRLRDILEADTAAILLVEERSTALVPRVARGIEEEVRQGMRVPIGSGFAGHIAQSRRPVMIDHVDPTTVNNPVLWEKGLRVMIGVPLVANDRVIGVLHVGRLVDRPFGAEDVQLLEIAGQRIAGAVAARLLALEKAAASLLERNLMPHQLPECPGVSLASRYVPAEQRAVGGDWYDVFALPSGRLWVVTGDVAGHGLSAAVTMSHVRSIVRAYAFLGHEPEEVLALTDSKLFHFEPGVITTVICAASAPPFDRVRLSTAGHPPPVLAVPGAPGRFEKLHADLPLGARPETARCSTTVELPPGGVLVFYTDGLIERRNESVDHRLELLRSSVTAEHPETVCQRVMSRLVGLATPTDDIAVVALRREPES
ncbi:MAG: SpoIIE family protein phosphatase [Acidimicrobiales bacterium]|nr:SpoIIE family protein phosphatase [Acidimicrobiales bacterium]MBO0886804.1 SpoIIE family protein phosphatase [Acidimicrobiales bacterium]MBO0892955.1 SpoIIE family protein phosphatase [Acidimicrobiales bacterium]